MMKVYFRPFGRNHWTIPKKLSFDEIIAHFGKETIEDRYKYLYDKMQDYIVEIGKEDLLYINESILHQVILNYFADIYRLKSFHKIEHTNITKIVVYEIELDHRAALSAMDLSIHLISISIPSKKEKLIYFLK